MKISVSARLAIDIDSAWEMLHTPAIFRHVSSPFTVFRDDPKHPLPERFTPDTNYTVRVRAGGVIPMGTQIIRLEDSVESWAKRETIDVGHGVSGLLALFRNWRHRMSVEALADGSTQFRDQLTVNASWLTPVMWLGFGVFWRWRALRLRRLAKKLHSPTQRAWDSRYLSRDQMWSGRVNPLVVDIAQQLSPGTALDIGCGEGADALWLAEHGWQVHAVDASAVALFRAHQEHVRRENVDGVSLPVTWRVADVDADLAGEATFDFVSLQFLHLEPGQRQRVWERARDAVSPGGTLLIVGHGVADAKRGIPRPPDHFLFDTTVFNTLEPDNWSEWKVAELEREVDVEGSPQTVTDVYLVAKR